MEVIEQEDSKRKSLSETGKKTKSILSVNSGRKSQRKRISWGNLQYRSFSKNDTLLNTSQDKHSLQEIPLAIDESLSPVGNHNDSKSHSNARSDSSTETSGAKFSLLPHIINDNSSGKQMSESATEDEPRGQNAQGSSSINVSSLRLSDTPLNRFNLSNLSFNACGLEGKDVEESQSAGLSSGFTKMLGLRSEQKPSSAQISSDVTPQQQQQQQQQVQTPQKQQISHTNPTRGMLSELLLKAPNQTNCGEEAEDPQDPSFIVLNMNTATSSPPNDLSNLLFETQRQSELANINQTRESEVLGRDSKDKSQKTMDKSQANNKRMSEIVGKLLGLQPEEKSADLFPDFEASRHQASLSKPVQSERGKRMSEVVNGLLGLGSQQSISDQSTPKRAKGLRAESAVDSNDDDVGLKEYMSKLLETNPLSGYAHKKRTPSQHADSIALNRSFEEKLKWCSPKQPYGTVKDKSFLSVSPLISHSSPSMSNQIDRDASGITSQLGYIELLHSNEESPFRNEFITGEVQEQSNTGESNSKTQNSHDQVNIDSTKLTEPNTEQRTVQERKGIEDQTMQPSKDSVQSVTEPTPNTDKANKATHSLNSKAKSITVSCSIEDKENTDPCADHKRKAVLTFPLSASDTNSKASALRQPLTSPDTQSLTKTSGSKEPNSLKQTSSELGLKRDSPPCKVVKLADGSKMAISSDENCTPDKTRILRGQVSEPNSTRPPLKAISTNTLGTNASLLGKQAMNLVILKSPKMNVYQKKKLLDAINPATASENLQLVTQKLAEQRRMSDSDWLKLRQHKMQAWKEVLRCKLKTVCDVSAALKTAKEQQYTLEERIAAKKDKIRQLRDAQSKSNCVANDKPCETTSFIRNKLSSIQKLTGCSIAGIKRSSKATKYTISVLDKFTCKLYVDLQNNSPCVRRFVLVSRTSGLFDSKKKSQLPINDCSEVLKDKHILLLASKRMMHLIDCEIGDFSGQLNIELQSLLLLQKQLKEVRMAHRIGDITIDYETCTVSFSLTMRYIPYKLVQFRIPVNNLLWNHIPHVPSTSRELYKTHNEEFAQFLIQTYKNVDGKLATIYNAVPNGIGTRNIVNIVNCMDEIKLSDVK